MSGSEKKVNMNKYDASCITSGAKQGQRNVQKKSLGVLHVQSCFFAN